MRRRLSLLLALTALSGCSLEPHFTRPPPAIATGWPVGDSYLRQSEAALPSLSWRDVFKDPKLQALIGQALANNQDLRLALANVAAARAQYRVQRAEIVPQVDASAGLTTRRSATTNSTTATAEITAGVGSFCFTSCPPQTACC